MEHSAHHASMGPGVETSMARCSMYMLWNTNIENTCVVFAQWHIIGMKTFVASFFIIMLLGALFEYLRVLQGRMEKYVAYRMLEERKAESRDGRESPEDEALLSARATLSRQEAKISILMRLARASVYGLSTAMSAFLMLVFMTYNAYLILAVVLGAMLGHFLFEARMDPDAIVFGIGGSKGAVCH